MFHAWMYDSPLIPLLLVHFTHIFLKRSDGVLRSSAEGIIVRVFLFNAIVCAAQVKV